MPSLLDHQRSSSWEACPVKVVAATIVVAERVEGSSLGHLVVKLAMYVWFHGDVASVLGAVQNSSSVWFGSVGKTEPRLKRILPRSSPAADGAHLVPLKSPVCYHNHPFSPPCLGLLLPLCSSFLFQSPSPGHAPGLLPAPGVRPLLSTSGGSSSSGGIPPPFPCAEKPSSLFLPYHPCVSFFVYYTCTS